MTTEMIDRIIFATRYIRPIVATAFGVLALYLLMLTINEYRSGQYIGSGVTATNTITVTGTGKAFAVPDVATFSITIDEKDKDMATARSVSSKESDSIMKYLKSQGIADKDIQTTDYSFNPTYEWQQTACPQSSSIPCPVNSKQTLTGYEVQETIAVKVRDTSKSGDILAGVNKLGADSVSGLSFVVDDDTAVQAQARTKAIADAKSKAQTLASGLGVQLVRVVGFDENGDNPRPVYYAKALAQDLNAQEAAPAPSIATGENTYTSNVSITYEIK